MSPALQFVIYLLALVAFVIAFVWPLFRRGQTVYSEVNVIALGLALVDLVWVIQSGQAAF